MPPLLAVEYFLAQQEAERVLLDKAEGELCIGIESSTDTEAAALTYEKRLHELLAPYRMATRCAFRPPAGCRVVRARKARGAGVP